MRKIFTVALLSFLGACGAREDTAPFQVEKRASPTFPQYHETVLVLKTLLPTTCVRNRQGARIRALPYPTMRVIERGAEFWYQYVTIDDSSEHLNILVRDGKIGPREFSVNKLGSVFWGHFLDGTHAFDARGEPITGAEHSQFWQSEGTKAFEVARNYLKRTVPDCMPKNTQTAHKTAS